VKRVLYKIKIKPCHFPLKMYGESSSKKGIKEVNNFWPRTVVINVFEARKRL
jgi:hypothetical protein